jgi:hypothetical protein
MAFWKTAGRNQLRTALLFAACLAVVLFSAALMAGRLMAG